MVVYGISWPRQPPVLPARKAKATGSGALGTDVARRCARGPTILPEPHRTIRQQLCSGGKHLVVKDLPGFEQPDRVETPPKQLAERFRGHVRAYQQPAVAGTNPGHNSLEKGLAGLCARRHLKVEGCQLQAPAAQVALMPPPFSSPPSALGAGFVSCCSFRALCCAPFLHPLVVYPCVPLLAPRSRVQPRHVGVSNMKGLSYPTVAELFLAAHPQE